MLWLSPPNWNVNSKSLVKPYFTSALLGPKSKGKGKWELVGKWVCTLDRRAIFSSSSSLSFSCSMSNCSKPWDKLKDSLNRRGVEQLESVSLSSEAIETIRSNSSFLDSSCCSWLTCTSKGLIYKMFPCNTAFISWSNCFLPQNKIHKISC